MHNLDALPSHHIVAFRPATVPFARLAARCLCHFCPKERREHFKIFIHADKFPADEKDSLIAFLSEEPNVTVTYGIGSFPPDRRILTKRGFKWRDMSPAPGGHQRGINNVIQLFSGEERIAFVDADLFLVDDAWFTEIADQRNPREYAITRGQRQESVSSGNDTFLAIRTELFCLHVGFQKAINLQRENIDQDGYAALLHRFPAARIDLPRLDTMLLDSLHAQLVGYSIRNVERDDMAVHIGGISHLNRAYLQDPKGTGTDFLPDSLWIRRLRLHLRTITLFEALGWNLFIAREYSDRIKDIQAAVIADPRLSSLMSSVPISWDERGFTILENLWSSR